MANPGKYFEEDFKKSINPTEISLQRLYDTTGGRAGIHYCADFIVYKYPFQYYLELKSTKGDRLNFNYISDNQYNGLLEKSKVKGVYAGVIINYREVEKSYFVDINTIKKWKESGVKSISAADCELVGVEMYGEKKRVKFTYDVNKLFQDVPKEVGKPWEQ